MQALSGYQEIVQALDPYLNRDVISVKAIFKKCYTSKPFESVYTTMYGQLHGTKYTWN